MSSSFHQTNKWDLMVPVTDGLEDLKQRAATIVDGCVSSNERVCIVMMHTPSDVQLSDLRDCLHGPNKSGWNKVALVGGHLGLFLQVVPRLKEQGFLVVEAVTDRISVEKTMPDGTVKKDSVFKYEGLRTL